MNIKKLTSSMLIISLLLVTVLPSYAAEKVDLAALQKRAIEDVAKLKQLNKNFSLIHFGTAGAFAVTMLMETYNLSALRKNAAALFTPEAEALKLRFINEGLEYSSQIKNAELREIFRRLHVYNGPVPFVGVVEIAEAAELEMLSKQLAGRISSYEEKVFMDCIDAVSKHGMKDAYFVKKTAFYKHIRAKYPDITILRVREPILSRLNMSAAQNYVLRENAAAAAAIKSSPGRLGKLIRKIPFILLLTIPLAVYTLSEKSDVVDRLDQNIGLFLELNEEQLAELAQDADAVKRISAVYEALNEIANDSELADKLYNQHEKALKTIDLNKRKVDLKKYGVIGAQ